MKDIPGLEGRYAVTENGRVWARSRVSFGLKGRIHKRPAYWLPEQHHKRGYRFYSLNVGGKTKGHLTHRLVAKTYIPNPDNLPEVNHKDCNKTNNHVSNLEWVTSRQNYDHAIANGRYKCLNRNTVRGERHWAAKLHSDQILEIRNLRLAGITYREIAARFSVGKSTVVHICAGDNWTHV